jgi:hypothetical protein
MSHSLQKQLELAQAEIAALKQSIAEWKDAWFKQRDIIADLWWKHPAIDSDHERAYYQRINNPASHLGSDIQQENLP